MTLMACRDGSGRYTPSPMEGTHWQMRAKAAKLTQRTLAHIAGRPENTVSRQLRGEFGPAAAEYLVALILAWEHMDDAQRDRWTAAIERARREKP